MYGPGGNSEILCGIKLDQPLGLAFACYEFRYAVRLPSKTQWADHQCETARGVTIEALKPGKVVHAPDECYSCNIRKEGGLAFVGVVYQYSTTWTTKQGCELEQAYECQQGIAQAKY